MLDLIAFHQVGPPPFQIRKNFSSGIASKYEIDKNIGYFWKSCKILENVENFGK